jgi:hypothetical protein
MKGPDSIIGKTVKCPACQAQFSVTGAPPPAAAEPVLAPLAEAYDEPSAPPARSRPGGNWIVDFILFRKLGTPFLIHFVFWPVVALLLYWGIAIMWESLGGKKELEIPGQRQPLIVETKFTFRGLLLGLAVFFLGPINWRIYCEMFLIFFRMNDTLKEVRHGIDELRKD